MTPINPWLNLPPLFPSIHINTDSLPSYLTLFVLTEFSHTSRMEKFGKHCKMWYKGSHKHAVCRHTVCHSILSHRISSQSSHCLFSHFTQFLYIACTQTIWNLLCISIFWYSPSFLFHYISHLLYPILMFPKAICFLRAYSHSVCHCNQFFISISTLVSNKLH